MTARDVLAEIEQRATEAERHVSLCGPCDGGLPMACTCATVDPRETISDLIAAVRTQNAALRAMLDKHQPIRVATSATLIAGVGSGGVTYADTCRTCGIRGLPQWPCAEYRAITDALSGVTTRTDR